MLKVIEATAKQAADRCSKCYQALGEGRIYTNTVTRQISHIECPKATPIVEPVEVEPAAKILPFVARPVRQYRGHQCYECGGYADIVSSNGWACEEHSGGRY